ncbi:alpha/beta hydrolase [Parerythrobacter aurantius]
MLPDGHPVRRIDWPGAPGKARGSILFMPGRGDNYEKYLETLDQWHRSGWRVTAADWRGQGGSGRLGKDAVTGHIDDFGHWIDDLAALWRAWENETPGPHVIVGHSMGGHLALRAVAEKRVDPDALVLSAPMLGFVGQVLPMPLMHRVAKLMAGLGDRRRPAWKWSEKPGETPAHREQLLTHDPDRYRDEQWWRDHRPEIVMGPGSWGWVERAYASMRGLFDRGKLEAVDTPVLLIATSADKLVAYPPIVEASQRLPRAELLAFGKEAHHEILREVDPVRDRAMEAISAFLDRAAPSRG